VDWLAEKWLKPHLPLEVWPGLFLVTWTEVRGPVGMRFVVDVLGFMAGWSP
jgi:hypothetical protein